MLHCSDSAYTSSFSNHTPISDNQGLCHTSIDGLPVTPPPVWPLPLHAGCGVPGYADGPAVQARFHNVRGIAVDAKGTVYIADSSNHCIRVLQLPQSAPPAAAGIATGSSYQPGTADTATGTAAGPAARLPAGAMAAACVVTTLSGCAGAAGFRDGPLAQARFRNPAGLAIDGDGCVLVADAENHCVRRIDSMRGTVTTIAGCRTPGKIMRRAGFPYMLPSAHQCSSIYHACTLLTWLLYCKDACL